MHSYLKAIGFSKIKDRTELEELLGMVIDNPTARKEHKRENGKLFVELEKRFSKSMGIVVRGEESENGQFYIEHYFPVFYSNTLSTKEEVSIIKKVDADAYTGMAEDIRLGVSLIFYIQNVIDYLEDNYKKKDGVFYPITLSAMSLKGKVLLPIERIEPQNKNTITDMQYRRQLIIEAKKGNQEAIDSLTIDDIDLYAEISRRVKREDLYSIVETSFTPYGSESDNYTVLGTITDVEVETNEYTKEEMYNLTVSCNDLLLQVCVNKEDVLGEPLPGRRYKGHIWLQGSIDFSSNKI